MEKRQFCWSNSNRFLSKSKFIGRLQRIKRLLYGTGILSNFKVQRMFRLSLFCIVKRVKFQWAASEQCYGFGVIHSYRILIWPFRSILIWIRQLLIIPDPRWQIIPDPRTCKNLFFSSKIHFIFWKKFCTSMCFIQSYSVPDPKWSITAHWYGSGSIIWKSGIWYRYPDPDLCQILIHTGAFFTNGKKVYLKTRTCWKLQFWRFFNYFVCP